MLSKFNCAKGEIKMKKFSLVFLALSVFALTLFTSCGKDETKATYDSWVEQIAGDHINPIHLTDEHIATMESNINEKQGVTLKGGIVRACQLQNNKMFAYVIEFEYEEDAKAYYELYSASGVENVYAKISGKIVVYGNNPVIESIK